MFKIAFRSLFRNRRRSALTLSAVIIGGLATLIFGGYTAFTILGFQTLTVQRSGHLAVYRSGYFDFGSGNPTAFGIEDHENVLALIRNDPALAARLVVATPVLSLFGIAGNFENDSAKTFLGVGFIPSDQDRMRQWDDYGVGARAARTRLSDNDDTQGVIGTGLARILGLCKSLDLQNCPPPPPAKPKRSDSAATLPSEDFADLTREAGVARPTGGDGMPRIDLLAATSGGAPNIVTLDVVRADYQGFKEIDEVYVGMNLRLAQQLLYGRGAREITGIVIQLRHTGDIPAARDRLMALFREHKLDLEVRDFTELTPFYKQVLGLYTSIFSFISLIMGLVVLFTVVNTVGMSVVERTTEIGTIRAIGVRRWGVCRQFLLEGCLLGIVGATAAVGLGFLVAYAVNASGLTWIPPGATQPVPLRIHLTGQWTLIGFTWIALVALATVAALMPALRAARLPIVAALRHV